MQDKDSKVQQITQTFKRIAQIKQDHVLDELEVKGGPKVDIEGYQKQSLDHQKLIEDVSKRKTEARQEITELEIELRRLKEQVSDIKLENKNLEYIIKREEDLERDKEALEEQALLTVTDDLQDQLSELKMSAEQITGKVTPYGFEQTLNERFRKTNEDYERFIGDSNRDTKETEKEVQKQTVLLEKEIAITDVLRAQVLKQENESTSLREQYSIYKRQFTEINGEHDSKLKTLDDQRLQANEDIKRISVELGQAQSEINLLILEAHKYESQLEFLVAEREMILKAQLDAEDIDPLFQIADLHQADIRRKKLEEKLSNYEKLWAGKLESAVRDYERTLTENEMREYRSRIAILQGELNAKNEHIKGIVKEREELEELTGRALAMGMEISGQSEEIEKLNQRYRQAVSDKLTLNKILV